MQSRVIRIHQTGGPEVLRIEVELPAKPGPGEVVLKVDAIGLNRAEAAFRAGQYLEQPEFPARLGYEASGTVMSIGEEVTTIAEGDAVCVLPSFSMSRYGVYGDWALVPVEALIERPPGMSAVTGASVWMAYLTAYGATADLAAVGSGDRVVITAASSSVGIAAIQICKMLDAVPIAVTRDASKAEALKALGADHVVVGAADTAVEPVMQLTEGLGARVVFDPVAGPSVHALAEMLAPGGLMVLYGNLSGQADETPFPFFPALSKGLGVHGFLVFDLIKDADRRNRAVCFITQGLAEKRLKPVVAKQFRFDQVVEAHRYLESNQQLGKIVMTTGSQRSKSG
jgi:NADPH:quinone reductase-like Zn-dependent oxidoreductase